MVAVCGLVTGCAGPADGAGPDIGGIDPRNFVYRGACAAGKPALDTAMVWGEQPSGAGTGDEASRAQVVGTRRVRLGAPARHYLLVRLQCSIGGRTATGWHLLGYDGDRPVDLGIVAAAYGPIDIREVDGELQVDHSYRTTADTGPGDSGRTAYRVALTGLTPVRLYGDERLEDVPIEVAEWPADAWRTGIVTVSDQQAGDEPVRHLGVQVDIDTVLAAKPPAGDEEACQPVVVQTHTGQRIDSAATAGWTGQGGTRVRLSLPSDAPDSTAVAPWSPTGTGDLSGLLVTGSGLVPALATAGPTGAVGGSGVPVTSAAPPDDALEHGASAPAAVFRDADAAAVLVGAWSADGGAVMQPLPDTSVPTDTQCPPA